jgi:hypothetical protein
LNPRQFRAAGHIAQGRARTRKIRAGPAVSSYRYRPTLDSARFGLTEVA